MNQPRIIINPHAEIERHREEKVRMIQYIMRTPTFAEDLVTGKISIGWIQEHWGIRMTPVQQKTGQITYEVGVI